MVARAPNGTSTPYFKHSLLPRCDGSAEILSVALMAPWVPRGPHLGTDAAAVQMQRSALIAFGGLDEGAGAQEDLFYLHVAIAAGNAHWRARACRCASLGSPSAQLSRDPSRIPTQCGVHKKRPSRLLLLMSVPLFKRTLGVPELPTSAE